MRTTEESSCATRSRTITGEGKKDSQLSPLRAANHSKYRSWLKPTTSRLRSMMFICCSITIG
ncbi:lectin, galactose binding, soluble 3, isoform CRA_d [Rattus norvegicus]|uniref:Lectin, galactose binding, soluble 3, isoform CRA_d n=1 Tax=Rattus norvegicus TaxID=10116 RepID=A6KE51_RAT|nr:lectin, galactose binding, soluble 3, isoform CRA_d [Rattus norvegicus]